MTVVQDPRIDAHALDGRGRAALQYAEAGDHTAIAELIRQHTAPPQPAAAVEGTAKQVAEQAGQAQIAALLEQLPS